LHPILLHEANRFFEYNAFLYENNMTAKHSLKKYWYFNPIKNGKIKARLVKIKKLLRRSFFIQ